MISRRNWIKGGLSLAAAATALGVQAKPDQKAPAKTLGKGETYDVVVLGAGTGGLVTAIRASQLGLKPIVLEKMDWAAGNSLYASGGIAAWGLPQQEAEGHPEPRDEFERDMMKVSEYRADPELVKAYCDNIREAVAWLKSDIGVQFDKIAKKPWPLRYRMVNVKGDGLTGGGRLIRYLLAACEKRGIPVRFNHKGVDLI